MTNSDDRQLVMAAIDGVAELPEDVMDRIGDERAFSVIAAAATAAVRRKFSTQPSPARIEEFVRSLQARFPEGADLIKQDVAEAVILGSFGHSKPLETVDAEDIQPLLFVLPYAIMSSQDGDEAVVEQFVAETLALAG